MREKEEVFFSSSSSSVVVVVVAFHWPPFLLEFSRDALARNQSLSFPFSLHVAPKSADKTARAGQKREASRARPTPRRRGQEMQRARLLLSFPCASSQVKPSKRASSDGLCPRALARTVALSSSFPRPLVLQGRARSRSASLRTRRAVSRLRPGRRAGAASRRRQARLLAGKRREKKPTPPLLIAFPLSLARRPRSHDAPFSRAQGLEDIHAPKQSAFFGRKRGREERGASA